MLFYDSRLQLSFLQAWLYLWCLIYASQNCRKSKLQKLKGWDFGLSKIISGGYKIFVYNGLVHKTAASPLGMMERNFITDYCHQRLEIDLYSYPLIVMLLPNKLHLYKATGPPITQEMVNYRQNNCSLFQRQYPQEICSSSSCILETHKVW